MQPTHKINMPTTWTFEEGDKGLPITVTGGKYVGREGWKHLCLGETNKQIYLILATCQHDGKPVDPAVVVRINKLLYTTQVSPLTNEELLFKQNPNLQAKASNLINALLDIDELEPSQAVLDVIGKQWLEKWARKNANTTRLPNFFPLATNVETGTQQANGTETADNRETSGEQGNNHEASREQGSNQEAASRPRVSPHQSGARPPVAIIEATREEIDERSDHSMETLRLLMSNMLD